MKSMRRLETENHVTLDDLKGLDARVNDDITRYLKAFTFWMAKLLGDSFDIFNMMIFALRQRSEHTVALRVENGAEMIMEGK